MVLERLSIPCVVGPFAYALRVCVVKIPFTCRLSFSKLLLLLWMFMLFM